MRKQICDFKPCDEEITWRSAKIHVRSKVTPRKMGVGIENAEGS